MEKQVKRRVWAKAAAVFWAACRVLPKNNDNGSDNHNRARQYPVNNVLFSIISRLRRGPSLDLPPPRGATLPRLFNGGRGTKTAMGRCDIVFHEIEMTRRYSFKTLQ